MRTFAYGRALCCDTKRSRHQMYKVQAANTQRTTHACRDSCRSTGMHTEGSSEPTIQWKWSPAPWPEHADAYLLRALKTPDCAHIQTPNIVIDQTTGGLHKQKDTGMFFFTCLWFDSYSSHVKRGHCLTDRRHLNQPRSSFRQPLTSGFSFQCENGTMASNDSTVVTGSYQLQLWSAAMGIWHPSGYAKFRPFCGAMLLTWN